MTFPSVQTASTRTPIRLSSTTPHDTSYTVANPSITLGNGVGAFRHINEKTKLITPPQETQQRQIRSDVEQEPTRQIARHPLAMGRQNVLSSIENNGASNLELDDGSTSDEFEHTSQMNFYNQEEYKQQELGPTISQAESLGRFIGRPHPSNSTDRRYSSEIEEPHSDTSTGHHERRDFYRSIFVKGATPNLPIEKLRKNIYHSDYKKQEKFRKTVIALSHIVHKKMYKEKNSSLEAYFRTNWKISRAQVYRFLDCASILQELRDFRDQPFRERLCRCIKQHAKTKNQRIRLWSRVLDEVHQDGAMATSTIIQRVSNHIFTEAELAVSPSNDPEDSYVWYDDLGASTLHDYETIIAENMDSEECPLASRSSADSLLEKADPAAPRKIPYKRSLSQSTVPIPSPTGDYRSQGQPSHYHPYIQDCYSYPRIQTPSPLSSLTTGQLAEWESTLSPLQFEQARSPVHNPGSAFQQYNAQQDIFKMNSQWATDMRTAGNEQKRATEDSEPGSSQQRY